MPKIVPLERYILWKVEDSANAAERQYPLLQGSSLKRDILRLIRRQILKRYPDLLK